MTQKPDPRSLAIARELVHEVGGQRKTASLVGVKQPSVFAWLKRGMTSTRENDLRFRFPDLQVCKRFPPISSDSAEAR